jgi:pimeloyl-ACP methyl ester carboxylesterase
VFIINPELLNYLNHIIATNYYSVTFSGDVPNILNRWLVKSELADGLAFGHLEPYLSATAGRILPPREVAALEGANLERNWRYYISKDQTTFYQSCSPQELFAKDRDKYIYALNSVYCRQAQRVVIYANAITPIRIWINGQLVLTNNFHYHIKPYLFIFDFEKGFNSILVEKTSFQKDLTLGINPDYFMIIVKPVRFLLDQDINGLFDPEILEDLTNSLTIIPEKAFVPSGQEIQFIVLPKVLPEREPEDVKVRITSGAGEALTTLIIKTGAVASVAVNGDVCGVLHLEATSLRQPERLGDVYLGYGDILDKRDQLIAAARKRRDCNEALIDTLVTLTEIADIDTGCIRKFPQTVQDRLYYPMFEKFSEFESYLHHPDGPTPKTHFDVYRDRAFVVKNSEIDDGFILYSIHLPMDYDRYRRYPLVVSVQYGYGMSFYPLTQRYVQKRHFQEAIVLNICGRGHLNRDYINEAELFHLFDQVIGGLNIDRDRVYIVGSCIGTYKAYGMALRRPDLFAVVAAVNGTIRLDLDNPDYNYIKNLNNTMVYQLCNIEDNLFNGARLVDTVTRLPRMRNWNFVDYAHDDFDEFLNQGKLMREMLGEKRIKYPKRVEYTTFEPIYNRSFWIRVDFIQNLTEKANVIAEIKSPRLIDVQVINISSLGLLLDTEAMGLEKEVEISVNGRKQALQLTQYSKVTISITPGNFVTHPTALSAESFAQEYDPVRISEKLMGIKGIYLKKCRIVRLDYFKDYHRTFAKKLFFALQCPLKERIRNYKYDLCWESELNSADFSGGNFIFVLDTREGNPLQGQILERFGLKAEATCLHYGHQEYNAEYFALLKYPNPWDADFHALILVFNNDTMEDELLRFLNSFDTNGLFYSDAVIYHDGNYHSFRKT